MLRVCLIFFSFICLPMYSSLALAGKSSYGKCYSYADRWVDLYIGASLATLADVSTNSAGNPDWQALYNPLRFLSNYGVDFSAGIRPLAAVPLLRNLRIEAQTQYRESRYKILKDEKKLAGSGIDKAKIPPMGKIYLKNVAMLNAYYDLRWFGKTFYPYVGAGFGIGDMGIRHVDFTLLSNGIGEEYVGKKKGVQIIQFMGGLQYDTKILKTSVFIEYRYTGTGKVLAYPTYNGNEKAPEEPKDANLDASPPPHAPPGPRNISFKSHAIIFGFKYYLY